MNVIDLGTLPYREAWQRQETAHQAVLDGGEETLFLVEHPPVITLGRRAEEGRQHLRATPQTLAHRQVELVESDRGGLCTFHGPGQLVAYPIIRLADHQQSVGSYMRRLQDAIIDTLAVFHVHGECNPDDVGVWVHCGVHDTLAKVAAFGTRVRHGVTLHGLALNVELDLSYFDLIDPCGSSKPVTSLHRLLGSDTPSMSAIKPVLVKKLKHHLHEKTSAATPPSKDTE